MEDIILMVEEVRYQLITSLILLLVVNHLQLLPQLPLIVREPLHLGGEVLWSRWELLELVVELSREPQVAPHSIANLGVI